MHSEFSLRLQPDQKPSCRWCYAAPVFFLWWVSDVWRLLMVDGGRLSRHATNGVVGGLLNRIWCQNHSVSPWFVVMRMRGCLVAEGGLLKLVSSVFVEFGWHQLQICVAIILILVQRQFGFIPGASMGKLSLWGVWGGKFTGTKQFLQYTLKSAGNGRGQQMVPHYCD